MPDINVQNKNGAKTEPEFYRMGSKYDPNQKRGRCVILNYKNFVDKEIIREGTEFDVAALNATFEKLNFDVIVHEDMTEKGTNFVLLLESEFDHSEYFCFILCILSHGEKEKFLCIDGKSIEYEFVYDLFNGNHCPSLLGKPKLFFIQACQGRKYDLGATIKVDSTTILDSHNLWQIQPNNYETRPLTGDRLIFTSSYTNYYAFRDSKTGSWLIQDLCEVLNNHADDEDLINMLMKVQTKVSLREANINQRIAKQMPTLLSTLFKKVHF